MKSRSNQNDSWARSGQTQIDTKLFSWTHVGSVKIETERDI